jgi:CubicO group peptidase (beta-lactamase class C family)
MITILLCLVLDFPRAEPASVGLDPKSLDNLVAHVERWVDDGDVVGAEILIVKNRKTVLDACVGLKDLERGLPVAPGTICCIRSMGKPFTGTAIQMLADEGKLALGDPASKYLPSFDNDRSRAITIEQLLSHRSGLPLTAMTRSHRAYSGQRAVADEAGERGPATRPGTEFQYSDAGTESLAAIVGVVSGMAPDEFIAERILEPLGLEDTFCVLGEKTPDRDRVSSNHAGRPGMWHKYWDAHEPPFFPYFLAAASMYSTTADYARFLTLWMDRGEFGEKRLLSEAAVARALVPRSPMMALTARVPYPTEFRDRRVDYGQLWMIDTPTEGHTGPVIFGHGGSDGTGAWAVPEQDLTAIYFSQSRGGLSSIRFESLLDALVRGEAIAPPPPAAPRDLARYVGVYDYAAQHVYPAVFRTGPRLAIDFGQQPGGGLGVLAGPDAAGVWSVFGSDATVEFVEHDTMTLVFSQGGARVEWPRVTPDHDLPSVADVMELRHEKLGGEEVKSLRLEGQVSVRGQKGTIAVMAARGGKLAERWQAGTAFERVVSDGAHVWRETGDEPLRERTGPFREETELAHPFSWFGDWSESGAAIEVVRREHGEGEDLLVLRLTPKLLPPITRIIGATSGELVREEGYVILRGVGPAPYRTIFGDHREVSGVRIPFRRTITMPGLGFEFTAQFERAEVDVELPAEAFARPSSR